ncbi:MAG: DUF4159 domain-containing protein [Verrucomicrobiota bacterium]
MSQTAPTIPAEQVGEIPTSPSIFKAHMVSVAVLMLAGLELSAWTWGMPALDAYLGNNPAIASLFTGNGSTNLLKLCLQMFGASGALCSLAGMAGLFRNRMSYHGLRLALVITCVALAAYVCVSWRGVSAIFGAGLETTTSSMSFHWDVMWPALATALYAGWLLVLLRSRSVHAAFTGESGGPMSGDYMLEDLRTHGRDPSNRRSIYASILTHLIIFVVIPYLLTITTRCSPAPYKVPKGSGTASVEGIAVVKMVKQKPKKKKKTLSLRPNSAIIFEAPDLDDAQVDKVMEEKTQETYQASNAKGGKGVKGGKGGKLGKGGGTEGGWPEGMEDYKVRFIRLEHSGAGWDDGMDASDADVNFLRAFADATGFKKIASKGESHSIALLKKYPKDAFPPFVFLTGNAEMGNVSAADIKILRDYCINGGMLIADAGSVQFHKSFMHFIRQVFPDKPLIDIADDDRLYQEPFSFPDGAPPFWQLGGRRALGIKHEGRWIAVYHPGDMNGAWKSPGYTDVTPEMREAAIHLGVNLVYYAFNQWNDAVSKAKK